MNPRSVLHEIGTVLIMVGAALALCGTVGRLMGDPLVSLMALCGSAGIALALGVGLRLATQHAPDLTVRDGIGVVTLGWAAIGVFGALPYLWAGVIPDFAGAVFETISGFTTTGASVIAVPEDVPRGILLWRASTHFLGGMSWFDAVCHSFATLATGGFSTRTQSIAAYDSLFSVTSIMSTTGFCTADFDRWPAFSKIAMILSMVVGGCVGSTAGGIKQLRVAVALKDILRRVRQFYRPQAVIAVKVNNEPCQQ